VRLAVEHRTTYRYAAPASLCYNLAHLTPRRTDRQQVLESSLEIDPDPDDRRAHVDEYGNSVEFFAIQRPHDTLTVLASSVVEVAPNDISPAAQRPWEVHHDAVVTPGPERELLLESPNVALLDEVHRYAAASFTPGRSLVEALTDLTERLHRDIRFEPGTTTVTTPISEVLERRRGVCQDIAQLGVACLRSHGLAARYVSGYLETVPPPGGSKLVGADATHAWLAVRLADGSWLELDPTNGIVAPEHHVVVAWGRDYGDVVPVKGVVMSAEAEMELTVAVDVTRIADEEPAAVASGAIGP
jgi:transglutaminase-like putative cysteine protease